MIQFTYREIYGCVYSSAGFDNVPIKHSSNKIKGTFINLENSLMPFPISSPLEANTDMISIAINSFCFFQNFI